MGIKALLKYARPAIRKSYIYEFNGKSIAIDVSCLIYKALHYGNHINYIRAFKRLLLKLKCSYIFVFDGRPPRSKFRENQRRSGKSHLRITPEIAESVKLELSKLPNSKIVQSPGESDPQLAFLALNGLVDIIVTEDSDLIVYGCECVVFKLNPSGRCEVYEKSKFVIETEFPVFRWVCIMAGCDYLPGGIKGLGLKKAINLVKIHDPKPPYDEDALRVLLLKIDNTTHLIDDFLEAERTFLYQNILDIRDNQIKPLNPDPPKKENFNLESPDVSAHC